MRPRMLHLCSLNANPELKLSFPHTNQRRSEGLTLLLNCFRVRVGGCTTMQLPIVFQQLSAEMP